MSDSELWAKAAEEIIWGRMLFPFCAALLGSALGFLGLWFGPIGFEKWKDRRQEDKYDRPRKEFLKKLLGDKRWVGRSLKHLCIATGTTPEECRRLLITIDARGYMMAGDAEGWALISKMPFTDE
ncbi:MAG: hypothetical protein KKE73_02700 [Proteobacteria bacterium]|nr:hypothetical protein [Pseudomonadota bacterium]